MDEWLKSFRELSDEELDEEYSRFEFSPYGFQDALCELAGPFGYFNHMMGYPKGTYEYDYVIRLVKRLTRELARMLENERTITYELFGEETK